MMKRRLFLITVIAAIVFAGCQKEKNVTYLQATIQNFQSANDGKVYIDEAYYACWHYTTDYQDQVVLNSTTANVLANRSKYYIEVASSELNASMYYSIFPASAVTNSAITPASSGSTTAQVTLPEVQVYKVVDNKQKVDALMAAMGAHRLSFLNLCGLLKLTITGLPSNAKLTKIEVTTSTGEALCGTGNVTFTSESSIALGALSGGINDGKTIKLQFDPDLYADGTYYIVVPPVSNTAFEFKVHYRLPDDNGTRLYSKTLKQTYVEEGSNHSIGAGQIAGLTLNVANASQEEHLPGAFSVGDGLQVYFSRGNLLYDENLSGNAGWNNGWGFELNQYTATEYDGNTSEVHKTGYIPMHFYKPNGHNTQYVTYPLLHNNGAYYGSTDNLADLPALAFGSNSRWRLLTNTEWQYLIDHANPQFVTVVDHDGVMFFPDLFEWPTINGTQMSQQSSYNANEWKQLEDAGCVFLPSAGTGNKQGGTLSNPGMGYYWSATPYNSNDLYSLVFQPREEDINVTHTQSDWGLCVRLVYDYTPTTNTTGK